MGTLIVILGIAIVITCFIHIWVDNLAMKRAIGKDDRPSYISDMENELDKANIELDNSMLELKDKLSKKVARELPKVVANGNNTMTIYLLASYGGSYISEPVVSISKAQYNLIKRHNRDTKWINSNLIADRLAKYARVYYVGVDYSWDINQGIELQITQSRKPRE